MTEILYIFSFWLTVEILGLVGWPFAHLIFHRLPDQGWGFAKIIGILLVAWLIWMLSSLRILPFNIENSLLVVALTALFSWGVVFRVGRKQNENTQSNGANIQYLLILIAIEELLLITVFAGWNYLRSYNPDLNGLEKFMDYGYMLATLRTEYFPPLDHFLAHETINYYYFGHYIAALITTLSHVPAAIGYNLQMSMIMALCLTEGFVIGYSLTSLLSDSKIDRTTTRRCLTAGILTALFIGLFGNLHAIIYYPNNPSGYWYPDATRFIENTIHEFPIYSFVVNDLHGHVSSIPIVLLTTGTVLMYFLSIIKSDLLLFDLRFNCTRWAWINRQIQTITQTGSIPFLALSFFIGSVYTINSWDFAIYLFLTGIFFWITNTIRYRNTNFAFWERMFSIPTLMITGIQSITLLGICVFWFIPFWMTVQPISQGIGIVPFAEQSPFWQLAILWGMQVPLALFFASWVYRSWLVKLFKLENVVKLVANVTGVKIKIEAPQNDVVSGQTPPAGGIQPVDTWIIIVTISALILIVIPEFIFVRDIYPTHYRANTMFKLFYQAWILLGIVSGYSITRLWAYFNQNRSLYGLTLRCATIVLIFAGLLYTTRAIEQGFGDIGANQRTLDGTAYLKNRLPGDADAIEWINSNLKGNPVILEAVGDSYTNYARVAANTGFQTVLGWPVHEWLWRGSYDKPFRPQTYIQSKTNEIDSVSIRVQDVKQIYETPDLDSARQLISKYEIDYIYIGDLEREKYPDIQVDKFGRLDTQLVYDKNEVKIYQIK